MGFALITDLTGSNRNFEIHTIVISERGRASARRRFGCCSTAPSTSTAPIGSGSTPSVRTRARAMSTRRLGFTYEGAWREAWRSADGSYDSLIFLGMLDREWAAMRGRSLPDHTD